MNKVNHYQALTAMRRLSKDNIPFSITFLSYNESKGITEGVKQVNKVILRTGYSREKGIKSESLVGYVDVETNKNRWFYLPLLLEFNKMEITCLK